MAFDVTTEPASTERMAIHCDAVSDLPGNLRREAKAGVHDIIHPSTLDRYIMNKNSQRMNEEKKEDNDDKGRRTEEGATKRKICSTEKADDENPLTPWRHAFRSLNNWSYGHKYYSTCTIVL